MADYEALLDILVSRQLPDGSFAVGEGSVGDVITTAQVVSLLFYLNASQKHGDLIKKALCYLLARQRADGKWDDDYHAYETATVAWVLCAFLKSGLDMSSQSLRNAWLWMMSQQKADGAFVQGDTVIRSNILCHAYVLRTLALVDDSYDKNKETALKWLTGVQNPDGGFGLYPSSASDPAVTAYVLHGVNRYAHFFNGNVGHKALLYLMDSQTQDGSWSSKVIRETELETTALVLFILRLADTKGLPIKRGFVYLDDVMSRTIPRRLNVRQLISLIEAVFVR
jgi:prenyltransferase beta subunit